MVLKSDGITTDKYIIPPFELKEGEIVVINLMGGTHFREVEMFLRNIFTGLTPHKNVTIMKPLLFAEHFNESTLKSIFYPMSVGKYLKKYANPQSVYATKIYDTNWLTKNTKVNTLAGNLRKQLSVFSTLSNTQHIVSDLTGQDPKGAMETYKIIQENVNNGGSAILLDWTEDMKEECTKYIEIEWLIPFKEEKREFKIQ
jgi:hypothetical protein